jgi:poly(3-hydroxybutyrate) depolymerase
MIKYLFILLILVCPSLNIAKTTFNQNSEYTLIIDGMDWGPAASKVVIGLSATAKEIDFSEYSITVERSHPCANVPANQAKGSRTIVFGYVSDANGKRVEEGKFATLVMAVAPNMPIGSMFQYSQKAECRGNQWVNYQINISHSKSNSIWNKEKNRIMPIADEFDLTGKYEYEVGKSLTYASFTPQNKLGKTPLIIWLHGGGEGGTDPSIALVGNKAFNYASADIQKYFGAAYVLVPQTPGAWMHDKEGKMQPGSSEDVYNLGLMKLIKNYVAQNPNIDTKRIYIGGCSNGGYMSLKLILKEPNYFAAGYISALAYQSQYITDAQINSIKNVPIWFIQAKDDKVTDPKTTAIPVYERLKKAGAKNVHFSLFDHVTDITGLFGGENYYYNGHWSWIYSHANQVFKEYDGSYVKLNNKPVSLMEWMAAQKKK